jgi:MoaA/NifB/PqqE/SkfB family radical SAM enzyme
LNLKPIANESIVTALVRQLKEGGEARNKLISDLEALAWIGMVETPHPNKPRKVMEDQYTYLMAILHGVARALDKDWMSGPVFDRLAGIFTDGVFLRKTQQKKMPELGFHPPHFVVVSPSAQCNLKCKGCYAESDAKKGPGLDYSLVQRIVDDKLNLWGGHFTVLSGGEPLLWKSQGKGVLDLAEENPEHIFLMYTNGLLIDEKTAIRMKKAGNMTPCLSLEGWEERTDARRGAGVYKKVLAAMDILRAHGVPFGISVTGDRHNWQEVLADDFVDYFFLENGAVYGFLFQYLPIGRDPDPDRMIHPADRAFMFERTREILREKKVFYVDFWNSSPGCNGCIGAGRAGGYFYIDYNGNLCPCVFMPFSAGKVQDLYTAGGDLNQALETPLFKKLRAWQKDYGFLSTGHNQGNWICPCPIRDHWDILEPMLRETAAEPTGPDGLALLEDPFFSQKMAEYGRACRELTNPIWKRDYLNQGKKGQCGK